MKTSLNSPTKYEQTRIDALRKLGCSACAVLGVPNLEHLELHHILDGGHRMGHYFSIFLCRGHHQGVWTYEQLLWIKRKQRFAISDGRKLFTTVYGTERSLWERAQTKLKLPMVWPVSKIVLRREYATTSVAESPTSPVAVHHSGEAHEGSRTADAVGSGVRDRHGSAS